MSDAKATPSDYYWQDQLVRLRPLHEGDWQRLYAEERDSEGLRVLEPGIQLPVTPERVQELIKEWNERNRKARDTGTLTFAVETLDGEFVGMANLHSRNPRHGTFSFAVRIFRPFRGLGYAREAVRLLLRYGFWELRYQKANSATIAINETSIRLHEALGFKIEGRLRRTAYTDGQYHDEILFGMTREEFDELEQR